MDLDVNSFAKVRLSVARPKVGGEPIQAPMSSAVIADIGEHQSDRLAGKVTPDLEINASDGLGGNARFEGFLAAPILEIGTNRTVDQLSGVGWDSQLDGLDFSIYSPTSPTVREETSPGEGDQVPLPPAKDGDIIGTMKGVTEALVANLAYTLNNDVLPRTKEVIQNRHNLNQQGAYQLWQQILDDSEVEFEAWEKWFQTAPRAATHLTTTVYNIVASKTPGFWNKMRYMMSAFQMHYIPNFQGPGFFKRVDNKVGEPEGEIDVSARGISLADGSSRIAQPGGVVMMASGGRTSREETSEDPTRPRIVASYPRGAFFPGFIAEQAPPIWLPREDGYPILGTEVDERGSAGGDKKDLGLPNYDKRKKGVNDYKEKVAETIQEVLEEYCEVLFKEIQLAHSSAVLTTPLDFAMNTHIGKRVTVNILSKEGDTGSFTAFIQGISHSVDLREGRNLNSYTQVRCTHCLFE